LLKHWKMPKVTKSESDSEKLAREIVEEHLQIEFDFLDFSGQVDYSTNAKEKIEIALEVTSFTNPKKWELFKIDSGANYLIESRYLANNWMINVQGVPNFRKINRELLPLLGNLEVHNLSEIRISTQGWWLEKVPTLKNLFEAIRQNNVEFISSRIGKFRDQRESDPRLVAIISSENWIYGGVDSSLELLEDFLEKNKNDRRKLQETGFANRHIFVWIDRFTKKEIRDIFDIDLITLPTRSPELPEEITHFWLVDAVTRRGMYFDSSKGWELITF
jgi:hypothetical protein